MTELTLKNEVIIHQAAVEIFPCSSSQHQKRTRSTSVRLLDDLVSPLLLNRSLQRGDLVAPIERMCG